MWVDLERRFLYFLDKKNLKRFEWHLWYIFISGYVFFFKGGDLKKRIGLDLSFPDNQNFFLFLTGRNEVVAKVMFLQVCVCPQGGGGCLPQCMLGCHTPPRWRNPPPLDQADPPRMKETPPDGGNPPGWRPPRDQADPYPPREADSGIRSTSGRCASYWNAFFFFFFFFENDSFSL